MPTPGPLMLALNDPRAMADPAAVRWLRRLGVSHQVWGRPVTVAGGQTVLQRGDPALDRVANRPDGASGPRTWTLVRLPELFPAARVATRAVVLPDGTVGKVEVVRSLDSAFGLDQEAIKAAKQWRFAPGTRFGEPVAVLVTIELTFTLR